MSFIGPTAWARARRLAAAFLLTLAAVAPAFAESQSADALKPKFGPHAIPIQKSHEYFRTHEAPDYWALSPFYVPQISSSACSLATVATLINALRGLPPGAADKLVTQEGLREAVGREDWVRKTDETGEGVTWDEFQTYLELGLKAYGVGADIAAFKPADASPASLTQLRRLLGENERSANDLVVVYFNQGVVTGDWDGPHVSPVAAYDAERRRVLIMDVDRLWYGPYWTSDERLLEAMLRPAPATHGALADETGGIIRVTVRRPAASPDSEGMTSSTPPRPQ
jgi:Phytochelatin synthase